MEEDGEATGTSGRSWGGSNLQLELAPAPAAPGGSSASIPARCGEIGLGEGASMTRRWRRGGLCAQIVRGRPAYIASASGAERHG